MSITEQGGKVITSVVDGIKTQPFALALVVINVLFIGLAGYFIVSRQDVIMALVAKCGALN